MPSGRSGRWLRQGPELGTFLRWGIPLSHGFPARDFPLYRIPLYPGSRPTPWKGGARGTSQRGEGGKRPRCQRSATVGLLSRRTGGTGPPCVVQRGGAPCGQLSLVRIPGFQREGSPRPRKALFEKLKILWSWPHFSGWAFENLLKSSFSRERSGHHRKRTPGMGNACY